MSALLSREEVSALQPSAGPPAGARRYDFRRPDRVSKDQLRSLRTLHEKFAQQATQALTTYLRGAVELTVASVDQSAYGDWLASLPEPTSFYALALPPFDDLAAFDLSPTLAFALLDRVMGGAGESVAPSRALTEIEFNIIDSVVRVFLQALTEAWQPVVDLAFAIRGRDTQASAVTVAAANDFVVLLGFSLKMGDLASTATLALPASLVDKATTQLAQSRRRTQPVTTQTERDWLHENLGRVTLPVASMIETRLAARDVLALQPGDIVTLGVAVDDPIDLRIAGVRKLLVRMVARNGRAAGQVVGPVARALAGEAR